MRNRFLLITLFSILLVSCASKPKFKGTGDLCGMIIDEKNRPVKDFIVVCNAKGLNVQITKTAATNESGLFVFYDMPSGTYSISGEKKNYLKIKETDYRFDDRSKIICLQTKTFQGAIQTAEEKIHLNQKKEADKILDSILCDRKSTESLIIQTYRFFTADSERERKSVASKIKRMAGKENQFFYDYSQKLAEAVK